MKDLERRAEVPISRLASLELVSASRFPARQLIPVTVPTITPGSIQVPFLLVDTSSEDCFSNNRNTFNANKTLLWQMTHAFPLLATHKSTFSYIDGRWVYFFGYSLTS
ncbi:uncharacterized protein BDZ99DRAFT_185165 [Mytilinidion resinicola]|uniref:Uncharacterized protein n=1 Tax=Mytilinidion resinicola TaxID=574789 RepID=A0A6A6Z133_9PEZI|nr:uncharacterized protein BDZ99DRAFT_185165 [Mytilinidion resinicola]KAF2814811.1 hypothetical protein BDZ99DRAFT_185165 [Mytilinidion resinicola]